MRTKSKHHKEKPVVDVKTGERFKSVVEAKTKVKYSYTHLVNQLNGNVTNKTTLIYL